MRLIDADVFEEFIRKNCADSLVDLWCELVRRQPTAYDKDKVIEELEETHKRFCNSVVCGGKCDPYMCEDCEERILVNHYIRVVSEGGICQ